jgi:hypothetical protein
MVSAVQICNLGLTKIGEESITALTDDTKTGRLCNLHYAPTRDMVLRDHIWNFSIKRVILALSTDTPAWEYAYQHALPSDFIRALTTNQLAAAEWKIARGVDAQEGTPDGLDADLWLNARLGYVSPYNA